MNNQDKIKKIVEDSDELVVPVDLVIYQHQQDDMIDENLWAHLALIIEQDD